MISPKSISESHCIQDVCMSCCRWWEPWWGSAFWPCFCRHCSCSSRPASCVVSASPGKRRKRRGRRAPVSPIPLLRRSGSSSHRHSAGSLCLRKVQRTFESAIAPGLKKKKKKLFERRLQGLEITVVLWWAQEDFAKHFTSCLQEFVPFWHVALRVMNVCNWPTVAVFTRTVGGTVKMATVRVSLEQGFF